MLIGKYQNSIDAKNRMIVPSKYREELGFKCILTKSLDKCLYIYPMTEWEKLIKKFADLPSTSDNEIKTFIRRLSANALECEVDRQGRMTIPQELREYANIEKELITVGVIDKVEVWSKSEWDNAENGTQLGTDEFARKMAEYGI